MTPYVKELVPQCLEMAEYDPNYSYDVDVEADEEVGGWGDETEEQQFEAEEANGDDDSSWKVRHAAVKTLDAFIRARSDLLKSYYESLLTSLVERFKERDENVKLEIFNALRSLLREAVVTSHSHSHAAPSSSSSSPIMPLPLPLPPPLPPTALPEVDVASARTAASPPLAPPSLVRQRSSFETLTARLDTLVAACDAQLRSGSAVSKKAVLALVRQLLEVCRSHLRRHLGVLVPHLVEGVRSRDATLKSEALGLLLSLPAVFPPQDLALFVSVLLHAAASAVDDVYTKTKAEALRALGALVDAVRAAPASERSALSELAYSTTHRVLVLKDLDQEVKEASISTMAAIVSSFGDLPPLRSPIRECLPIFVERMENEVRIFVLSFFLSFLRRDESQRDFGDDRQEDDGILAGQGTETSCKHRDWRRVARRGDRKPHEGKANEHERGRSLQRRDCRKPTAFFLYFFHCSAFLASFFLFPSLCLLLVTSCVDVCSQVTRLSALRAMAKMANSSLHLDLTPVLRPAVDTLAKFLRQQSQTLKQETVRTLEALVRSSGAALPPEAFLPLLREVSGHVCDSDLHLSELVLRLVAAITAVHRGPQVADFVCKELLDRIIAFVKSPLLQVSPPYSLPSCLPSFPSSFLSFSWFFLFFAFFPRVHPVFNFWLCPKLTPIVAFLSFLSLPLSPSLSLSFLMQGAALEALIDVFQSLLAMHSPSLSFGVLLSGLLSCVSQSLPKESCSAVAQCVAAIAKKVPRRTSRSLFLSLVTVVDRD